jgi:hypothetical protein
MQQQALLIVEMAENVLRTAAEPDQPAPDQTLGETLRQREAQIRPALVERGDLASAQPRRQRAHRRLDLRQLRHAPACAQWRACRCARPLVKGEQSRQGRRSEAVVA